MENLDPYLTAAWLSALAAFVFISASKTNENQLTSRVLYLIGLVALGSAGVSLILFELKILEWL